MTAPRLADPVAANDPRLRLSYSAAEVAQRQAAVDVAQGACDRAVGVEHGAAMTRRYGALSAAQTALDYAAARVVSGGNPGTAPVVLHGIYQLDDELVEVVSIEPHWLVVARGVLGTVPIAHLAAVDLVAYDALAVGTGSPLPAVDGGGP